MIPLINRVSAGRVIEYDHEQGAAAEYHDANAYIPRDKDTTAPLLFAATIVGDSMEPSLHTGDIVVFDPVIRGDVTPKLKSGDVVYVRWAKGTGVYGNGVYRVFFENLPTIRLTKDNKKYPEIHTQVTKDFIDQMAVAVQLRTSWGLRGKE
jgi:phage repressor protein C with HTH and peptisase S24 domain